MRKKNQEIKSSGELETIFRNAKIVRIAIMDGEKPYLVPLNYGYRHNCLYIHCAKEGKKLDLLRKNNNVCFEIESDVKIISGEKACQWTTSFRSVVGYGEIEIIEDQQQKIEALKILMTHFGAPHLQDFDERTVQRTTILKLNIAEMTGKVSGDLL